MKSTRFAFFVVFLLLLQAACVTHSQDPPADDDPANAGQQKLVITALPSVSREIHDAMQSRNYGEAIKLIETAIGGEGTTAPDYLRYLQGIAQTNEKQFEQAIATFDKLEADYPKSSWLSRSRFGRANVYVRQRLYIKAGEIYKAEAERLLSRGRKDELCKIYLEFANQYFEGLESEDPSKAKKPDYAQALTYYNEAIKLGPTVSLRQKVDFRIARCHEERNELDAAIKKYTAFLDKYAAESAKPDTAAPIAMSTEATFRLGSNQLKAGRKAKARRTWQDLLSEWDGKDKSDDADAINTYLAKAEYRLAHTYGLPTPVSVGDLELAVGAAEKFLAKHPDHPLASKAELEIAQGFAHHRRHDPAIKRLESLIANPKYAESKQVPDARQMLGQQLLARGDFDDAITAWRSFLDEHPTDPRWPQVQQQIVNTEFAKANAAMQDRDYEAARATWQTFLNKYPLDHRASKILYQFGQMKHAEATQAHNDRIKEADDRGESAQSIQLNDQCKALYQEAIVDWRRVVSKYPSSHEASNASLMIGRTLEEKLGQLKEALDSYKKVKGGFASQAASRISRLTSPQLTVVTERKFRSDESPRIKLTTRNLESVTVKVYRVDMVDYFRKMHLASGVETLDIALIDPDEQFEHQVGDYTEYRQTDEDIELPIEGPGVTAVTVSSEKLEATTMVVVSDLDMIVKASRNELFLFAQNMRTGKPVPGASVLVSNGSELFGESITGDDGILQQSFDELKGVADLRVFAVKDGHMMSTVNNLNGLDFAVGLTPRGYLFTERPAYRRGQLVNIKGIVRWVDQDRYTFKSGDKFTLDVYDSRGRKIHGKELSLNDFGTINSNVVLPESAPQGDYRVHLHRNASARGDANDSTGNRLSFETRFKVTEYKLEPVQIEIDLDKSVYFRGEKVVGTIHLKYYYGTPLKNEAIEYRFGADGETVKAKTDEKGSVKVELDTQRFSEAQPLKLSVTYPQRSVSEAQTVYLATKGFAVTATTMRPVYINGESFESTFKVADPAGKPVQTTLKVEVFRRTSVKGRTGEKLVQTHEVATEKEDGTARKALTLDDAGVYFVRATGEDQFGNDVSGQLTVRVSGDKDETRLRILADQFSYQVGDDANINLHWREAPSLALVTYEGATVLGHQLVQLKKGDNQLKLPMQSAFAPNFYLSVAVMQRNRFHTAQSEFRVSQKLNIALKPTQTELRPGEDLSVQIEATDPQGNPVQTELSLALIQTNLLNMFGDVQGPIDTFFGDGNRKTSVRQSTSCTFSYKPRTRPVSQFLLAESERRATLENEVRALAAINADDNADDNAAIVDGGVFNRNMIDVDADGLFAGGAVTGGAPMAMPAPMVSGPGPGYNMDGFGGNEMDQMFGGQGGGAAQGGPAQRTRQVAVTTMTTQTRTRMVPVQRTRVETRTRQVPVTTQRTILRDGRQVQVPVTTYRTEQYQVTVPYTENVQQSYTVQVPVQSMVTQNYTVAPYPENLSLVVSTTADTSQRARAGSKVALSNGPVATNYGWGSLSINGVTKKGQFLIVNNDDKDKAQKMVRENAIQILPAMAHAETAFWDPAIVTDAKGQAFVTITTPQRSTAWRLRAKGINKQTLSGEATADIITRKDLFGELKLPLAFTAGDKATIPVEVHSALEGARGITVKLKTTMGDTSTEQNKAIDTEGPGVHKLEFPIEIGEADQASFQLTVSNGDDISDTSKQNVTIRPFGFPVFQTASGTSSQSTLALIDFDAKLDPSGASLEIVIGADVDRALIESVTDAVAINPAFDSIPQQFVVRCGLPISNPLERATSDVLGGVALLKMIGDARASDTPEAQSITGRITSAVAQLVSAQQDKGGWAWSGQPKSTPDVLLTARIMWALSAARDAGFAVPQKTFDSGKAILKTSFSATSQSDLEQQAVLLHAMAKSGCGDFAFANRLHRERNRLSASGLTHLALTLTSMNRKEMATDLIAMIKLPTDNTRLAAAQRTRILPWMRNRTELQAMYLLALQEISPNHPDIPKLTKTLLSARIGPRWPVEKSNGPVIAGLAHWNSRNRNVSGKYKLVVFVNDHELKALTIDPDVDGSRRIQVPAEWLHDDRAQRIEFELDGRATFSYSAVLTGFVPADKIVNTTKQWSISRSYQPAQRMLDGRTVPRGFGVVNGSYRSFVNPLTQLHLGNAPK